HGPRCFPMRLPIVGSREHHCTFIHPSTYISRIDMKIKLRPLDEQVIVITGASSGIGLATAYEAAKKGAKLVLAARSEEDLDRITQEINSKGGEAIFVVAAVGRKEEVEKIASAAKTYFGRFDTWVNDAGVSIYGRLEKVSDE